MDEEKPRGGGKRQKVAALLMFAAIAVIGIIVVVMYLQYKKTRITTDDAYIEGRVHVVASKVSGTVKKVHVSDNQLVKKGELILDIDAADFEVKVKEAASGLSTERSRLVEAETKIEAAKMQLTELGHRVGTAKAQLELQNANLRQAELDVSRAESLIKKDAISRERYEKTKTGYDISVAQVKSARDQVQQAEVAVEIQKALIRQAVSARTSQDSSIKKGEAQLTASELSVGYAKIYAPADGYITKKSVQAGNQIQPGQPLMAVVPLDDIWITANFKETQLEKVRAGQTVKISVDTYPGRIFDGKVESIMAGTGAAFSLFPPENATGNYVKVVQRIPVKIVLDKNADVEHILRVGMSVEPTILVGK
ncbi:MAG: HlyD family secretion protein [Nitrospirae bacterium]|nr:HlyD family secretion protein [Nitrospirota bacterium]